MDHLCDQRWHNGNDNSKADWINKQCYENKSKRSFFPVFHADGLKWLRISEIYFAEIWILILMFEERFVYLLHIIYFAYL